MERQDNIPSSESRRRIRPSKSATNTRPEPSHAEPNYEKQATALQQCRPYSSAQFTPITSTYVQSNTNRASTFNEGINFVPYVPSSRPNRTSTTQSLRYQQYIPRSEEPEERRQVPHPIFNPRHPLGPLLQSMFEQYHTRYLESASSSEYTIWEPESMSPPPNYDSELDARTHFQRRDDGILEHVNYVEPPPIDLTGEDDDTEPAAYEIPSSPEIVHRSTSQGREVYYRGQFGLEYRHYFMGVLPLPPPSPSPESPSTSPSPSPPPTPTSRTLYEYDPTAWDPVMEFPKEESEQLPPYMRPPFPIEPPMRSHGDSPMRPHGGDMDSHRERRPHGGRMYPTTTTTMLPIYPTSTSMQPSFFMEPPMRPMSPTMSPIQPLFPGEQPGQPMPTMTPIRHSFLTEPPMRPPMQPSFPLESPMRTMYPIMTPFPIEQPLRPAFHMGPHNPLRHRRNRRERQPRKEPYCPYERHYSPPH